MNELEFVVVWVNLLWVSKNKAAEINQTILLSALVYECIFQCINCCLEWHWELHPLNSGITSYSVFLLSLLVLVDMVKYLNEIAETLMHNCLKEHGIAVLED